MAKSIKFGEGVHKSLRARSRLDPSEQMDAGHHQVAGFALPG